MSAPETSSRKTAPSEVLSMRGISKGFPGVQALSGVDFDLWAGEVHAIVGENGAGKSTLIKILSGACSLDAGEIVINGQSITHLTPQLAQELGLTTMYQERNLVPLMTVGENILLNREPRNRWHLVDRRRLIEGAKEILGTLGIDLDPAEEVSTLSAARQQAVELAKALFLKANIVIMDEPTAAIGRAEIQHLFAMIRRLSEQGVSVIYISHRLEEVFEIADRVTVLRDGRKIGTFRITEVTELQLVNLMVGRELGSVCIDRRGREGGEELLRLEHLTIAGVLDDVNLTVRRGEILGIAGMVGSGRTEMAEAVFGARRVTSGHIIFRGRALRKHTPSDAIARGICLVPEERKFDGLILGLDVAKNITLASLQRLLTFGFLNTAAERRIAAQYVQTLDIRTPGIGQEVQYLSGGNQQKVVLAKWLLADAELLIVDEPTKGVDVGAKEEIHRLMRDLADRGKAIVMISSDLPEILAMSHRVAVMRRGRLVTEFSCEDATQEKVLAYAIGGETNEHAK